VEDIATLRAFFQNRTFAGSGKCLTGSVIATLQMSATDQRRGGWICCQLGAREHYAVARSIHCRNALQLLVTDAWVRPGNFLGRLKPGLSGRYDESLATAEVYARTGANISFELRSKINGLTGWPRIIARNKWFQTMAVERLSRIGPGEGDPVVMAYSYAALDILELARSRGWRAVLGQIDPGPAEEEIVSKLHDAGSRQSSSWERAPKIYWSEWRRECTLADRIVVNSSWSRDALVGEGIPTDKIRVVPLAYAPPSGAVEFQRYYPSSFDTVRPLRVLFLGQINLRKGISPLMDAIRLLRGEPIEFTLAGDVQVEIPADLRNDPRVKWVGSVPREQTSQFYRDADLFVFPTFSDGFGLTQLEAQAWSLPIVTSKFCGKVVEDEQNGWILPVVTPDAIARAIRSVCQNPNRLQEMSGRAGPAGSFGLDRVGQQWLDVFD
jgi:glycosyltransferase involved in cell wall biosynthesis